MAIFRRDAPTPPQRPEGRAAAERPKPSSPPPARSERPSQGSGNVTLVARGSRFVGKISGPAEVVIEGEVEGEIVLDGHVQIGSHGKVRGNLEVRSARISGQLTGNVKGHEVVELTASGKLEGDVSAPRVIIAEGAFFRGNIEMTGKKAATPSQGAPGSPTEGQRSAAGPSPGGSPPQTLKTRSEPG